MIPCITAKYYRKKKTNWNKQKNASQTAASPQKTQSQKRTAPPTHFRRPNRPSRNSPGVIGLIDSRKEWLPVTVYPRIQWFPVTVYHSRHSVTPATQAALGHSRSLDYARGSAQPNQTEALSSATARKRAGLLHGNARTTQKTKHMRGRNGAEITITRRCINSRLKRFPRHWKVLLQEHFSWLMGISCSKGTDSGVPAAWEEEESEWAVFFSFTTRHLQRFDW